MERSCVAVLMGGVSGEHEVSLNSGRGIVENMPGKSWKPLPVVIHKDGSWQLSDEPPVPLWDALGRLVNEVDVVFPALHGPNGEDGTIQGLLQLVGLPYVGSDSFSSALAMNKPRTKDVYRAAGLTTPESIWLTARDARDLGGDLPGQVGERLGYPCVAKTSRLGSSVGVAIVPSAEELPSILEDILPLQGDVLLERFVKGTELTSSIIDDPDDDCRPRALPLVEIRPVVSGWFDYEAKYQVGGAEELCPAPIDQDLARRVQQVGLQAHRVLGCFGMSRTDVIVEEDTGLLHVIETNTIPGFTGTSLLPQAAAAAGIDYPSLVDLLLRSALSRAS